MGKKMGKDFTFIEYEGKRYRIRPSDKRPSGYSVSIRKGWRWGIVTYAETDTILRAARAAGRIK